LWAEFARIIGEVQPSFVWVENSPMLVGRGLDVVCGDLAALGYDAKWGVVSASDAIWANSLERGHFPVLDHLRERIWILGTRADTKQKRGGRRGSESGQRKKGRTPTATEGCSQESPDSALRRLAMQWWTPGQGRHALRSDMQAEGDEADDPKQTRLERRGGG
jgi:DNA (cytosine-5)-methyltransferase 1